MKFIFGKEEYKYFLLWKRIDNAYYEFVNSEYQFINNDWTAERIHSTAHKGDIVGIIRECMFAGYNKGIVVWDYKKNIGIIQIHNQWIKY